MYETPFVLVVLRALNTNVGEGGGDSAHGG
jgi:hypothetical protein